MDENNQQQLSKEEYPQVFRTAMSMRVWKEKLPEVLKGPYGYLFSNVSAKESPNSEEQN